MIAITLRSKLGLTKLLPIDFRDLVLAAREIMRAFVREPVVPGVAENAENVLPVVAQSINPRMRRDPLPNFALPAVVFWFHSFSRALFNASTI